MNNNQHIAIETIYRTLNPNELRGFEVHFNERHIIHVTHTSNPFVVYVWIKKINLFKCSLIHGNRRFVVGLGIRWSPNHDFADTLQLCVGHRCLVIQLEQANIDMKLLRRFLLDHTNNFVGFFKYKKRHMLLNSRHNLFVRNFVDIRDLSKTLGGRNVSMEQLANSLFGFEGEEKSKIIERSNWDDEMIFRLQKNRFSSPA